MLSVEEATRIGQEACINKLGIGFVQQHQGFGSFGYGEIDGKVFCFVGVDPFHQSSGKGLILDHQKFPCRISCTVDIETGEVVFVECVM